MFEAYTPIQGCIGKEITVRVGSENHVGMLAGVYFMGQTPILVITPMQGGGSEQHIPMTDCVVTVRHEQR